MSLTILSPILNWHIFFPEDVGTPGQNNLQEDWHVTFQVISAQIVLQFSVGYR